MTEARKIWLEINGVDGLKGDSRDHAGVFLVALAIADELTPKAVAKASGLGIKKVSELWNKAEECGIIRNGRIHANWADEQDGAMSLIMDSLVLDGSLVRVPPSADQPVT